MEVSVQNHDPASLPEKTAPVSIEQEAGWAQSQYGWNNWIIYIEIQFQL
jgi:hypothetical protein